MRILSLPRRPTSAFVSDYGQQSGKLIVWLNKPRHLTRRSRSRISPSGSSTT